jgi:hypothetical protein
MPESTRLALTDADEAALDMEVELAIALREQDGVAG